VLGAGRSPLAAGVAVGAAVCVAPAGFGGCAEGRADDCEEGREDGRGAVVPVPV
jgi:hypothetical protein